MKKLNDDLRYSYSLPSELIAKEPVKKRDEAKLFVYDSKTGEITHSVFSNIGSFLPKKYSLVLNETVVAPARMTVHKKTGGKIIALFLVNEKTQDENVIRIMVDRNVKVGDEIIGIGTIIAHSEKSIFVLKLKISRKELLEMLRKKGAMPIPLYLRDTKLQKDELLDRYQTVFAHENSSLFRSVAAPTASLHFTPQLLKSLQQRGAIIAPVTLHVGLGTFAPVTDEQISSGTLHHEWYSIPELTIKQLNNKPIVAVGTTVVRTLESYAKTGQETGTTDIFIRPPYEFQYVDNLITNFHLPNSSLMMLVEAFLQYKKTKHHLKDLYEVAIAQKYRFYSFGDAMLIR